MSELDRSIAGDGDEQHSIKRVRRAEEAMLTSQNTATAPAQELDHHGTGWRSVKVETRF